MMDSHDYAKKTDLKDSLSASAPIVDLSQSRAKIDAIDEQIIDLFQRRMRIVRDVADYKRAVGKAVYDGAREARKIKQAQAIADPQFKDYMAPLFDMIMEMSRSYQDDMLAQETVLSRTASQLSLQAFPQSASVACQGVAGAYSHIAAMRLFESPEVDFADTWEDVCDAVESGSVQFGVLPLENSTAGAVDRVYDLLRKRGLYVVRALTLRINHDLLAKPDVSLDDVCEVYSHEQALRQCSDFIENMPQGDVKASIRANTAMAAAAVASSERCDIAAISSAACADIYGLEVLASGIQDEDNNFTRFVCVSREPALYGNPTTSSFLIVTPHEPGSLHRVLSRLATLGINATKLQSRPIPGREFEFMFYVDLECVPGDEAFMPMARQIPSLCDVCMYLGSYEEVSE